MEMENAISPTPVPGLLMKNVNEQPIGIAEFTGLENDARNPCNFVRHFPVLQIQLSQLG